MEAGGIVEPEIHKWKWKAILGITYACTNYCAITYNHIFVNE